MSQISKLICSGSQLIDGEKGVRFNVGVNGKPQAAFVVRFGGEVHAFVNSCPHLGVELDWEPGEFFDLSGVYLVCATHGAVFMPDSGYCTGGPCKGRRLVSLPVRERDGEIFLGEGLELYVE